MPTKMKSRARPRLKSRSRVAFFSAPKNDDTTLPSTCRNDSFGFRPTHPLQRISSTSYRPASLPEMQRASAGHRVFKGAYRTAARCLHTLVAENANGGYQPARTRSPVVEPSPTQRRIICRALQEHGIHATSNAAAVRTRWCDWRHNRPTW